MSENDTFYKLKYGKYRISIELIPGNEEQIDEIIDRLRTTRNEEPEIADDGITIYRNLSLEELSAEIFCLGICYKQIEDELKMHHPSEYTVETEW